MCYMLESFEHQHETIGGYRIADPQFQRGQARGHRHHGGISRHWSPCQEVDSITRYHALGSWADWMYGSTWNHSISESTQDRLDNVQNRTERRSYDPKEMHRIHCWN